MPLKLLPVGEPRSFTWYIGFLGTQCLQLPFHLQAVADVADNINKFTVAYISHTLQAHAQLLALAAIKAANFEAYQVYTQREAESWRQNQVQVAHRLQNESVFCHITHYNVSDHLLIATLSAQDAILQWQLPLVLEAVEIAHV